MSLILQIETATTVCSVALSENGAVLALKELEQRNVHAEVITVFIDEVLKAAGRSYPDLKAVAVSCGPGSYTGLRIGVSIAKGLCYALDIPLISVETLEAMTSGMIAQQISRSNDQVLFCPMIDARRMEVFTAVFDADGNKIKPTSARIIEQDSFDDLLETNKLILFGDGAAKCKEVLADRPHVEILSGFVNSARYLTPKAAEKYRSRQFEDTAYFEPYYLKDFIAGKKAL